MKVHSTNKEQQTNEKHGDMGIRQIERDDHVARALTTASRCGIFKSSASLLVDLIDT